MRKMYVIVNFDTQKIYSVHKTYESAEEKMEKVFMQDRGWTIIQSIR